MSNVYRFRTKPFPWQYKAVIRALKQGYIGLLWDPGKGKTKVIVDWASALYQKGELSRVLIICPLSVMGVWEDEFALHCPVPYWLTLVQDTQTELGRVVGNALHVVVINYDKIWRDDFKRAIHKYNPQMVVGDESHRFKKASANRSWAMRALRKKRFRAILTGTPTPRSLLDLYMQWVFLNSRRFGTDINRYKALYIRYGGYMSKKIVGYTKLGRKEIPRKVKLDASIQRIKPGELPDLRFQRIRVQLEPKAREMYDRLARELFLEIESGEVVDAANAGVKILRLQQLVGGWIGTDKGLIQISKAKFRSCCDLLEGRKLAGQRVVTFARFLPEVENLSAFSLRLKVPTMVLRGGVRQSERDRLRRAFQAETHAANFIAQIQTGGLGITLHAANEVIVYSSTYAFDDYDQAYRRVWRTGQTNPVIVRLLVAEDTIDEDIYEALGRKENVSNLIMGNPKRLLKGRSRLYH